MDDKITKLNNIEGLRLLKLTKLDYSKNIINLLKDNPNCLPTLLEALEVTEEEFSDYLLDNKKIDVVDKKGEKLDKFNKHFNNYIKYVLKEVL